MNTIKLLNKNKQKYIINNIHIWYLLILLMLILSPITSSIPVAASSPDSPRAEWSKTLSAYVPAVSEKSGELIKLYVSIKYPGSGHIFVQAGGSVGNSTYYSVKAAIWTAALLLGLDPRIYDINVTFNTNSAVSGPSASLAVASLFYIALNPLANASTLKFYTITGAVIPQGYAGPVGGIKEKCLAANSLNLTFIAPLANREEIPAQCRKVSLATSILDVAHIVSGAPLPLNIRVNISYPEGMAAAMRNASASMVTEARRIIADLEGILEKPNTTYREEELQLLREVDNLISLANETRDNKPYTSASYAFTALQKALTLFYLAKISRGELSLDNEIEKLQSLLDDVQANISSFSGNATWCLERFEILSVAAARVSDAYYHLELIKSLHRGGNIMDPVALASELAGARARISSINSWLQVLRELKCNTPIPVGLVNISSTVRTYSSIIYNYTTSVLKEAGGNDMIPILKYLYSKAEDAFKAGNIALALGYYRDLLAKCTFFLFDSLLPMNETGIIRGYLNESFIIYRIHAMLLAAKGVASLLAPAYLEYATDLAARGDYISALSVASSAIASEEVLELLLQPGASALTNASVPSPTPQAPRGEAPSTTGLAAVVLSITILAFALGYALAARSLSIRYAVHA
jgi:predicted S18 family serine protease